MDEPPRVKTPPGRPEQSVWAGNNDCDTAGGVVLHSIVLEVVLGRQTCEDERSAG